MGGGVDAGYDSNTSSIRAQRAIRRDRTRRELLAMDQIDLEAEHELAAPHRQAIQELWNDPEGVAEHRRH